MNVSAVLARLEEERAEDLESLRQCAERSGDIVEEAEERNDSEAPVYDAYFCDEVPWKTRAMGKAWVV
jgi:hypothetical protein